MTKTKEEFCKACLVREECGYSPYKKGDAKGRCKFCIGNCYANERKCGGFPNCNFKMSKGVEL